MQSSPGLGDTPAPRKANQRLAGQREPASMRVTDGAFQALLNDARERAPEESCGLLAGRDGLGAEYIPLPNESPNPRRSFFVRNALFSIQRRLRSMNLDFMAIIHSHPAGPAFPSRTDQEQNFHGTLPHMIVSLSEMVPEVRAFRYGVSTRAVTERFTFEEIPVVVTQDDRNMKFHNGVWVFDQAEWDVHGF